jgi:N-acetylmuramoyl-L-alanine amidase
MVSHERVRAPIELHAGHGGHGGAATNTPATEDNSMLNGGARQHQDLTENASKQSVMVRTGRIGAAVRKNERARRREPADTAAFQRDIKGEVITVKPTSLEVPT